MIKVPKIKITLMIRLDTLNKYITIMSPNGIRNNNNKIKILSKSGLKISFISINLSPLQLCYSTKRDKSPACFDWLYL